MEKELNQLKKIQEKLALKKDAIELKIEARENAFEDKSEKWQESEKGIEHQEKTQALQDFFDELDAELMALDDVINNLEELAEREV